LDWVINWSSGIGVGIGTKNKKALVKFYAFLIALKTHQKIQVPGASISTNPTIANNP
jgi:hypothetical protein